MEFDKMYQHNNGSTQRGSSIVEFFVSLLVFIPLFIGIPLLGKYANIKHKTIEASRYVAWERTVYTDPVFSTRRDSWTDSNGGTHEEARKSATQILVEAERRLFGHPQQGFHDTEVRANPMWVNRKGESLLSLVVSSESGDNPLYLSGNITHSSAVDHLGELASIPAGAVNVIATGEGFSLGRYMGDSVSSGDASKLSNAANSGNSRMGGVMDGSGFTSQDGCGFPGINLNEGIGLGTRNYSEIEVATPVINFLKTADTDTDFSFKARSAVLSNAWTLPSESKFHERLDNIVPNQLLGCIVLPGRYTFGLLSNPFSSSSGPVFGEVKLAYPVRVLDAPSTILPNELKYYDEDP